MAEIPLGASASSAMERVLANRGLDQLEQFELKLLHNWQSLSNIQAAVDLLVRALKRRDHILVIGDYDADGATGTALAVDFLSRFGAAKVSYLVPNRFDHGYGLTLGLVKDALELKPDVIITVDHGSNSLEGVECAIQNQIEVLITDHHLCGERLPEAVVVNPNQPGCQFPSKNLAGVGVIFYVLIALRAELKKMNYFAPKPTPNMASGLDLVALGTIADVVTLDYNNRCLVQQGLLLMRQGKARPGIVALAQAAKVDLERVTSTDLGFRLAPRLNAAGRMASMSRGVECLLAETPRPAKTLATELNSYNQERRQREGQMKEEVNQVLQHYDRQATKLPFGICLADPQWHLGLVGIIAARIRERWNRPALILAPVEAKARGESSLALDDLWRGSVRSIEGVHIHDVLIDMDQQNPGMMETFGGHAAAAGLAIRHAEIKRLPEAFALAVERATGGELPTTEIVTDGQLEPDEFTLMTALELNQATPWGKDFPPPVFHGIFELGDARFLNNRAIKLTVKPIEADHLWLSAIVFDTSREDWPAHCQKLQLVYELAVNRYREVDSIQLVIQHWQAL